nr:hypothetical protein Iba_chr05cCG17820 [Ipomoea batatas]
MVTKFSPNKRWQCKCSPVDLSVVKSELSASLECSVVLLFYRIDRVQEIDRRPLSRAQQKPNCATGICWDTGPGILN